MTDIKKKPAISIITYAFNVEDYIRGCAESVLKQTFTDFEWVVLDNGSTDKTSSILEEYARKDNRIRLFRNQKNSYLHPVALNSDFVDYEENLTSEYWCVVDSDDFLHADFMKELYYAAKKYDADIAVGGTEMFHDENPNIRSNRCPPDFYSKDITRLGDMLPQIYGCFRPMWGKLFKVSIVKKRQEYRKKFPIKLTNGADTVFCLDCLKFSNSVVGVNKVLHYYRIRKNSYYNTQVDDIRYLDYKVIFDQSNQLLQRWNKLNTTTLTFITQVLYFSIKDCMDIAANAVSIPPNERIAVIETMCNDPMLFRTFGDSGLTNNFIAETQRVIEKIMDNVSEADFPIVIQHYMYRLFTSIRMANFPLLNQQSKLHTFLLYVSSIYDEKNKNRFGSVLLYSFLKLIGKTDLSDLESAGIKTEFLVSNPVLLRELVNSRFEHAIQICEEHSVDANYNHLSSVLQQNCEQIRKPIYSANEYLRKALPDQKIVEAIEWMTNNLTQWPLDKETFFYRLYLLTLQGDVRTALETAETILVFFPDDSTASIVVAQTLALVGQKERAKDILENALSKCVNETKRLELTNLIKSYSA
ncbi:glycosyltransferase involved in cell wall biosynthesis [Bacillus sp. SORGH_AS 510]|uniref:glycosyltransferase family 2 protein n=1 Tax=Bacillus sp. SORGH_AS_0510 TaxID=3041771 RepID=UPI00278A781C|nr:glycosyltransferase family 2 protein [Bacillus sp. SORGH_AS_0510]MDQ1147901.1 glycosyltransferase involved in cell wall biosynthesis [Bacillus sp. SORGH_AS_0510]